MSGQLTGHAVGGAKTWVMTVVIATAIGGTALGTSWGTYSAHVVSNAVGVVTKVAPMIGGWITEGRTGVAPAPTTPAVPPAAGG